MQQEKLADRLADCTELHKAAEVDGVNAFALVGFGETVLALLDERVDLLRTIAGDWCPNCGYDNGGRRCHCENND